MKIKEISKCVFIPWYLAVKRDEFNVNHANPMPELWGIALSTYIVFRLGLGVSHANNPDECRIKSFADMIITPMYAIGCNLAKERFDIRVN